jgi:hypothetical protein
MNIHRVRKIAKTWGVETNNGRKKGDIIREIQIREGFSPCFDTRDTCAEDCLWKKDCIGLK